MASEPLRAVVFLGSTRRGRNCDRVAKFIVGVLRANKYQVDIADPAELDIPMLENPLHFYPDRSKAPANVLKLNEMVVRADAVVVLSAEYNRNIPPALSNLLDHVPPRSYCFKTSAIVTYSVGPGGGGMVAANLRSMLVEFGCAPIPYLFQIGGVTQAINENGEAQAEILDKMSAAMLEQLGWYASALKNHRETHGEPAWGPVVSIKM